MEVKLEVDEKYHIKPVQKGDQSISGVTIEKGHIVKPLESINVI